MDVPANRQAYRVHLTNTDKTDDQTIQKRTEIEKKTHRKQIQTDTDRRKAERKYAKPAQYSPYPIAMNAECNQHTFPPN